MSVVLLSRDLILLARAQGAANKLNITLLNANSTDQALELALAEPTQAMIIDLRLPGLNIGEIVTKVRDANQEIAIVACGPHVHETSLTAAKHAGCDVVATRGQFERDAEVILEKLLGAA